MLSSRWGAALLVLVASGCHKVTYSTGAPVSGNSKTQQAHFFIAGLVGTTNINLQKICPDGVAWFQNRETFVDGLLSAVTFSLYTPMTIEVRCSSGSAYLLTPDPETAVTWVEPVPESPLSQLAPVEE